MMAQGVNLSIHSKSGGKSSKKARKNIDLDPVNKEQVEVAPFESSPSLEDGTSRLDKIINSEQSPLDNIRSSKLQAKDLMKIQDQTDELLR